jgi:hypothetical protein
MLKKYESTDFEKESLVIFFYDEANKIHEQITSFQTQLTSNGKLEGVITLQYKAPPYTILTAVRYCSVIIKMDKKEEAMVDNFRLELKQSD